MNDDHLDTLFRSPGLIQGDTRQGIYRGLVVDPMDPELRGRVRVHIYGLHGDYAGVDSSCILWSEPINPFGGSVSPPEFGARVWVAFEAGDLNAPIVLGQWYANGTGRGTLPMDLHFGSEISPDTWSHHDQYPEGLSVFRTGEGSSFFVLNKLINNKSMESVIQIVDTGGKFIRTKSFHLKQKDNTPVLDGDVMDQVPDNLDGKTIKSGNVARSGFGTECDVSPGSIKIRIPFMVSGGDTTTAANDQGPDTNEGVVAADALARTLLSGPDNVTCDSMTQLAVQEEAASPGGGESVGPAIEEQAVAGMVLSKRINNAVFSGMQNNWFFNTSGFIINAGQSLSAPRRYDVIEENP